MGRDVIDGPFLACVKLHPFCGQHLGMAAVLADVGTVSGGEAIERRHVCGLDFCCDEVDALEFLNEFVNHCFGVGVAEINNDFLYLKKNKFSYLFLICENTTSKHCMITTSLIGMLQ